MGMAKSGSDKKVANSLVAVSCAAVLAVYSAGYSRTRAAATQFEAQSAERRPAPGQQRGAPLTTEVESPSTEPSARTNAPSDLSRETATRSNAVAPTQSTAPQADASSNVQVANVTPEPTAVVAATPVAPTPVAAPVVAVVAPAPAPAPPAAPKPKWKDGTYTGWGTSRHGDIEARVVIEGGRIQGATISQCLTRYSCDVIDMLPPQVAARQSADVDYVSRATQSADAFYYAVTEALNKASSAQ